MEGLLNLCPEQFAETSISGLVRASLRIQGRCPLPGGWPSSRQLAHCGGGENGASSFVHFALFEVAVFVVVGSASAVVGVRVVDDVGVGVE